MKIVQLITDEREHHRKHELDTPYFGTAPTALLQGFAMLPDVEVHIVSCTKLEMKSPAKIADNIFFHSVVARKIGWLRTGYQGCIRAARRKIREIAPDIVHGQGSERDASISAVFSGFPSVVTIHGNMAALSRQFHARPGTYLWAAGLLENITIPRADGVLCNSAYTESLVKPRNSHTWRVPNALRSTLFGAIPAHQPGTKPRIVNVGVVCPRKQQLELLAMFKRLHAQGLDFEVEFVGLLDTRNSYGQQFEVAIRDAKEKGYAFHSPYMDVDALVATLDHADACVHFPTEEAFGLIVAEAMARNLKFFGSHVGGIVDIATGVDGAQLIPLEDWSALELALAGWINSGFARPRDAAKNMAERYHPKVIATRHVEIYREVLARKSR